MLVPLQPLLSSKQSFSLRWLHQCSPAPSPENEFSVPPPCSRGLRLFEKFFSSKKFSRVVVYCSVIKVPVVLSQATALIFYQICFALSRTFLFFCFAHPLPFRSVSSDSLYRLSHLQGVVNSFFHLFFQRFRLLLFRSPAPGCSASASPGVSGWPDLVRLFKAPSSATGAILSLQNGIVNVFFVFYLFQTIHAIPTIFISFHGIIHM